MADVDVRIAGANDFEATENSDIVVFTVGFPRKPGMSPDDLLWANYDIVKATVEQSVKHSPNAILIVVSNLLDAMCHVAYHVSGFPKHRVVGWPASSIRPGSAPSSRRHWASPPRTWCPPLIIPQCCRRIDRCGTMGGRSAGK